MANKEFIFLSLSVVSLFACLSGCNKSEPLENDVVFVNPDLKTLKETNYAPGDSLVLEFVWSLNNKAQILDVSLVDFDQSTFQVLETYNFSTFSPNSKSVNEKIRWKIPQTLNPQKQGYSILFEAVSKKGQATYREVITIIQE